MKLRVTEEETFLGAERCQRAGWVRPRGNLRNVEGFPCFLLTAGSSLRVSLPHKCSTNADGPRRPL